MSGNSSASPRQLPNRPNLRHLKDQAKDLLRGGEAVSLSDAQRQIAHSDTQFARFFNQVNEIAGRATDNRHPEILEDHDLTFGLEMCVAFGQTINPDDKPGLQCNKGTWGTF